jgi:hypothetical protein
MLVSALAGAALGGSISEATPRIIGMSAARAAEHETGGAQEEGILDEETLRRIVADVVRQELQGALGERITRNVRKLVRREIRLMLAADELD